ncbi:MAG: phosphoribosylanthranilate isomerase [Desulfobacterales bacterium]|jgi:phosphoribosylanthranilate isomerase
MSPFAVKCERPQVKICGLTRVDEALACAAAGADAVGCVFYPKSPRFVTTSRAEEIRQALERKVTVVGVFVDAPDHEILRIRDRTGIDAVQLHGREPPEQVERLVSEGLLVVKALFANTDPSPADAERYPAGAFLVECAGGPLPGGNALAWDWAAAKPLAARYPLVIAGGLTADTVFRALLSSGADAVDVSSGVELAPGRKSPDLVAAFIDEVARCADRLPETTQRTRRIFP